MYTEASVKRLIQPVALCALVVLGAFPAVTLACQWACVRQVAGQTHHHATQHESPSHPSHDAAPSTDLGVISEERPCAHAATAVSAISTFTFKAFAPIAVHAAVAASASPIYRGLIAVAVATPSPPGARSAPLALRI